MPLLPTAFIAFFAFKVWQALYQTPKPNNFLVKLNELFYKIHR